MARTKVQSELIATNAISGTIIADNAITATHIATNAISGTLVQDSGITTTMIASNNVTAAKIVSDGIETRHLHSNVISGQSAVTAASGDYVLIGDTSDSNNLKKALVSDFGVSGISSSADATAITIDSSENVGIGTSSPSSILHIVGGSATIPTLSSSYPLTISNNGNSGLNIISSGTTNAGQINFGDSGDADAGRIRYDHNDNSMRFTTNAAEYMRIASNGNVGIGETSPLGKLHIKEDDSGASSVNSNFDQLVLEDDSHSGMTILSGTSGDGAIYFGDSGANNRGQFKYRHSDDSFGFITADGSDYALILKSDDDAIFAGNVSIGTTSVSASGSNLATGLNYSITEGANSSYVNLFRQASSAATVLANGYRCSSNNNAFASSFASSWAKSALSLNYGTIRFYTDAAATTAVGTDVTPTERLRIDAEGNLSFGTQKVDPNWSQFFNAISGNYGGHVSFQNNSVPVTTLGNNFYLNNSTLNERVLAYPSQQFKLDHQQNFLWESAASGTAGDTFSFTEHMRLNANGTLMVGGSVNPTYPHRIYATGNSITNGTVRFDDNDVSCGLANVIMNLSFGEDNDCTSASFVYMTDGNGAIGSITAASGTSVNFNTTSDERLKKNIVDASSQLDTIKNIKIREFDWKKNDFHEVGVIAQEIKTVVPNAVQEGGDDETKHPFGVDYGKIVPYLIKAVQEQQTIIEDLKSRIQTLEG